MDRCYIQTQDRHHGIDILIAPVIDQTYLERFPVSDI